MTDIVAFLRARLDEDQATAVAAAHDLVSGLCLGFLRAAHQVQSDIPSLHRHPASARHDAELADRVTALSQQFHSRSLHDRARALREVEAKRRIVELYEGSKAEAEALVSQRAHGATVMAATGVVGGLHLVLEEIAAVYADHADYDPAWKPEGKRP